MKITFKSGRVLDANRGIVGLSLDLGREDNVYALFTGFDDCEHTASTLPEGGPWTSDERLELAEMMVARWRAWAGATRLACPGCGTMLDVNSAPAPAVKCPGCGAYVGIADFSTRA